MFERLLLKNVQGYGPLIDVGVLAEGLLFYEHVEILANSATLEHLFKHVPPRIVLSALRTGRLKLKYLDTQLAVATSQSANARSLHDLVKISSSHGKDSAHRPYDAFVEATGDKSAARRFAREVQPMTHQGFEQNAVLASLRDASTTEVAVQAVLRRVTPIYAEQRGPVRFRIEDATRGFFVDTNIDFEALNDEYHVSVPKAHSSMTEGYLLALLQGVHEELYLAGHSKTEIAVGDLSEDIHDQLINGALKKATPSASQLEAFNEMVIGTTDVRNAVNAGHIPFADVLRLADKADKFREWLRTRPADSELVKEYYAAVVSGSWAEKLPAKSTRFGVFTAAGIALDATITGGAGTAAGVALGAFDTFVLDKLIGGWKPHHFVEGDLKKTLGRMRAQ